MPIQTRNVIGYINDLTGQPVPSAIVRAGVFEQPLLDVTTGIGVVGNYIETVTTSTGAFSIPLPRGFIVLLSIPIIGYKENIMVPDDSSDDINFISLTPS